MRIRTRLAALATVPAFALATALGAAGAASASTGSTGPFNYETDNGVSWQLTNTPTVMQGMDYGYADAGIVVDLGQADGFPGITVKGSGPLAANVWIGDGANASTPGFHSLSDPAGFSYGFQQPDGSFWMTSGPYAGQTLTPGQIATDFAGEEVYAWVGVVFLGSDVSGHVSQVNGHGAGANVSITSNGSDLTARAR